jgi:hypothetical protein
MPIRHKAAEELQISDLFQQTARANITRPGQSVFRMLGYCHENIQLIDAILQIER